MKHIMDAAASRPRVPMSAAALEDTFRYWTAEYPRIPDKTRGNIVISATTVRSSCWRCQH